MKYRGFCILLILFCGCKVDKKDIYLPENFSGEVALLYVDYGTKPIIEDGRQKIFIPDSAIVFLNEKYEEGEIDYRYYIKTAGGFSQIVVFKPGDEIIKGRKYVYFERTMNFYLTKQTNVLGHFFFVGQQLDSTAANARLTFERKVEKIVHSRTIN